MEVGKERRERKRVKQRGRSDWRFKEKNDSHVRRKGERMDCKKKGKEGGKGNKNKNKEKK